MLADVAEISAELRRIIGFLFGRHMVTPFHPFPLPVLLSPSLCPREAHAIPIWSYRHCEPYIHSREFQANTVRSFLFFYLFNAAQSLVITLPTTISAGKSTDVTWHRDNIDFRSFVLKRKDLHSQGYDQDHFVDSGGALSGTVVFQFPKEGCDMISLSYPHRADSYGTPSAFTIEGKYL
jgi:hypothetical protein